MITQPVSSQNFNGNLVFVDKYGRKADAVLTKEILSQLGSAYNELKILILPKPFDLFISKSKIDYIDVNANKTYKNIHKDRRNFYSLHKSTLNKIVQVAKTSIKEYESFLQKNV